MRSEQFELFERTLGQQFEDWSKSPAGAQALDLFCRLAVECHGRGRKIGAKAIWERMRWDMVLAHDPAAGDFQLNNNFTAYAARVAMRRHEQLRGWFETRDSARRRPSKAVIVPIRGGKIAAIS